MAELVGPYRHRPQPDAPLDVNTLTTLKIAAADTITITWMYNVGNNGVTAKWGDPYFLLARNLGSQMQGKLVEYEPIKGKVYDGFERQFGISARINPSKRVAVPMEPLLHEGYGVYANYGQPMKYSLTLPGPLYGSSSASDLNQPLYEWWQEVARREAFSYLSIEFAYYQLDKDKNLESQILPKVDGPAVKNFWLSGFGHQTHKFQNLIRVLWEEDR